MTDYEKLKVIIDEIDDLINHHVTSDTPAFIAWKNKAERFLVKKYGKDSIEYEHFNDTDFSLHIWSTNTPDSTFIKACKSGLVSTKLVFQNYLDELDDDVPVNVVEQIPVSKYERVFIVHGNDGELKQAVARIIEKQDVDAIILSEQAKVAQLLKNLKIIVMLAEQYVYLLLTILVEQKMILQIMFVQDRM